MTINSYRLMHLFAKLGLLAALVAGCSAAAVAQTLSVTFPDYVKGPTGVGDINLLTPKSQSAAPDLKNYVATYNAFDTDPGKQAISFGFDINESANGTEKAETQAVAVEYAWLEVTDSSGTRNFGKAPSGTAVVAGSNFFTETQATLAANGSTSRSVYYTLLGKSGSSQITGSITDISRFDSTLKIIFPAGVSLSGTITKAILHVRFLNVNVGLGDPEAFYDFTGGFEDIALLVNTDSQLLDTSAEILTPRDSAPVVELSTEGQNTVSDFNATNDPAISGIADISTSGFNSLLWIQKPGAGAFNLVAYEDLYPSRGDYDFNDAIVGYNYSLGVNGSGQVEKIAATAYLLARGAQYSHDWTLRLPLKTGNSLAGSAVTNVQCQVERSADQATPGAVSASGCSVSNDASALVWKALPDTRGLFPGTDGGSTLIDSPVNTYTGPTLRGPKASMTADLTSPIELNKFDSDDTILFVLDTARTINLNTKDNANFPFAMVMPTQWRWPQERVEIGTAYPSFLSFISSLGTTNLQWYNSPQDASVSPPSSWTVTSWAW